MLAGSQGSECCTTSQTQPGLAAGTRHLSVTTQVGNDQLLESGGNWGREGEQQDISGGKGAG